MNYDIIGTANRAVHDRRMQHLCDPQQHDATCESQLKRGHAEIEVGVLEEIVKILRRALILRTKMLDNGANAFDVVRAINDFVNNTGNLDTGVDL